jgi:signal transduction histidine kinase
VYALGSLLGLAGVYFATRYVGRPFASKLEELAQSADALADDPGSTARARWEHADEIGRLTRAFDTLVEKWRDIQSSLERRVEQRTEQLAGALQQAQEANRTKSEFLAVMSHEIRTPMNGVVGMVQVLETTALNDDQRRQLQIIRGSSDLLLRIIDDLLDFARIDAGKLALDVAPFAVDRVVQELVESLQPAAAASELTLQLAALPPEMSRRVAGDKTRLRQVLTNLVHNAIKFTRPGGRVDLKAGAEVRGGDLRLEFVVSDTGVGIEASKLDKIFDPFEQADRSTTRRYGGTGLGLAIVKRLVDLMGGTIEVRSRPGQGSTFTVRLSLPLAAEAQGRAAPCPAGRGGWGHLRVLVAEDNPTNQLVAMAQLQSLGIDKVTLADDGRQAVAAALAGPYDLILMDIHMPEMDGCEAATALRAAGVTAPIVAMTANVMEQDRLDYARAGMLDCVAKPMDLGRLREALERCVDLAVG